MIEQPNIEIPLEAVRRAWTRSEDGRRVLLHPAAVL
jgi:hypothetical protein